MTVHGMPDAGAALAQARTRRGRRQMLLLFFLFLAPVLASYYSFYVLRPSGEPGFGTLIEPQRAIPEGLLARTLDGNERPLSGLRGQWLLVSVAGGGCQAPCRDNLYLQRQLRESLGREKERLDWVWLVSDEGELPADLAPALSPATVLRVPAQQLGAWLAPAEGHALAEHLYVVDPMGHWMMRFPARLDTQGAAKARRDIERLLRASSSWDLAGRPGEAK